MLGGGLESLSDALELLSVALELPSPGSVGLRNPAEPTALPLVPVGDTIALLGNEAPSGAVWGAKKNNAQRVGAVIIFYYICSTDYCLN